MGSENTFTASAKVAAGVGKSLLFIDTMDHISTSSAIPNTGGSAASKKGRMGDVRGDFGVSAPTAMRLLLSRFTARCTVSFSAAGDAVPAPVFMTALMLFAFSIGLMNEAKLQAMPALILKEAA